MISLHRVIRKKNSVEAMLKTAMQSQLDDVKLGLNQLQAALHDIQESRQRCASLTAGCLLGRKTNVQLADFGHPAILMSECFTAISWHAHCIRHCSPRLHSPNDDACFSLH